MIFNSLSFLIVENFLVINNAYLCVSLDPSRYFIAAPVAIYWIWGSNKNVEYAYVHRIRLQPFTQLYVQAIDSGDAKKTIIHAHIHCIISGVKSACDLTCKHESVDNWRENASYSTYTYRVHTQPRFHIPRWGPYVPYTDYYHSGPISSSIFEHFQGRLQPDSSASRRGRLESMVCDRNVRRTVRADHFRLSSAKCSHQPQPVLIQRPISHFISSISLSFTPLWRTLVVGNFFRNAHRSKCKSKASRRARNNYSCVIRIFCSVQLPIWFNVVYLLIITIHSLTKQLLSFSLVRNKQTESTYIGTSTSITEHVQK